ncbi:zinc transporter ZIP1-like isoform X1 [Hemicordylus capensis]|uniref:zinc transporter ZIP1-like isoform X1 n=1 Tax=Hemicordylus capensis TaxID=884348 RepID=UPI0023025122|nr:zinc transporter ZIP1-like isoform X1 [Hemicordylus capensis]
MPLQPCRPACVDKGRTQAGARDCPGSRLGAADRCTGAVYPNNERFSGGGGGGGGMLQGTISWLLLCSGLPQFLPERPAQVPVPAVCLPGTCCRIQLDFPMPELILATGFLLVLVTEHVVLACSEQHLDEATLPLLPCPSHHQHREEAASAGRHPGLGEAPGPGSSEGRSPASPFRSLVLTLSLSLHSVFEGLAVGLQEAEAKVLQLAVAILLHKSLIAFSLALLLLQSRLPLRWLTASVATFALMSPLGVGLGMVVTHSPSPDSATARSLLEGVAAGTFMYITFLEILPQELSAPASRLPKVLAVLLGFSGMAGLRLLG